MVANTLDANRKSVPSGLSDLNFLLMCLAFDCKRQAIPAQDAGGVLAIYLTHQSAIFSELQQGQAGPAQIFDLAKGFFVRVKTLQVVLKDDAPREIAAHSDYEKYLALLQPFDGTDHDPLKLSRRNNHQLLKSLCLLEIGGAVERAELFAPALNAVQRYLENVNDDGIAEVEAIRGASAAWYLNTAVMMITSIFLSLRDMDLSKSDFDFESGISTLKRMARALDNVLLAPHTIHHLSRLNMYPHPNHSTNPLDIDLTFLKGYHSGRNYLAWIPLYESLTDDHDSIHNLRASYRASADYFPHCNDFIGGFVDIHGQLNQDSSGPEPFGKG